ncbi:lysine transporter LysE [Nocardioides sp. Root1257]|uniref:LysE family transporter n=1 Tax=unclassified Nocardioides TaxID=2615069 RepID=UPI0006F9FEF3|nr:MULTISPECIES: LysE family transporter [unclassified Nocardioides]KQW46959.1 lysine transporter LysE [Nocardioides sp. Root1257]KRC43706.1 lysine transporter LysE [Nocardioides sp. Root224]
MLEAVVSGLVTGWAIAIPIGAVGAFLVTLASRTSFRVGAAGALGIATVDGGYALLAVAAGAAVAAALEPVAHALTIASGIVLLVIAGLTAVHAIGTAGRVREVRPMGAGAAYALFLGITAVNPTTVVYFAAVVLGNQHLVSGAAEGVVFVLAAFVASASWQLLLAGGGAALGRVATGHRAHLVTGLVSAAVIALLAIHTMLA